MNARSYESIRAAIAVVQGVKDDFSRLKPECPDLKHCYMVHPPDYPPPPDIPWLLAGRKNAAVPPETYLESHIIWRGDEWVHFHSQLPLPNLVSSSWYVGAGADQFDRLAQRAGGLLAELRIRATVPSELKAHCLEYDHIEDPHMLPGVEHLWARYLHWSAWSGAPLGVARLGWWWGDSGPLAYPYVERSVKLIHALKRLEAPWPPRMSVAGTWWPWNQFHSTLDSLCDRSVAALTAIEVRLTESLAEPKAAPEAPSAESAPADPAPTTPEAIDWDAIILEYRTRFPRTATRIGLVEHMRDRKSSSFEDIAREVHGGHVSDDAIRQNCVRVNEDLALMNCPLSFSVSSGHVIRRIASV